MFEDMARIDIPRIIVIHSHSPMINLVLVINNLEMVRPVTGSFVTFLVTITWMMTPPLIGYK